MKKFKKIFAVLLTLAMVLGMSMTTFAAKRTEAYITVENAGKATLEYVQVIMPAPTEPTGWAFTNDTIAKCYTDAFGGDAQSVIRTLTSGNVDAAKLGMALSNVAKNATYLPMNDNPQKVTVAGVYAIKATEAGYTYNNMAAYIAFKEIKDNQGNVINEYPSLDDATVVAKKTPIKVTKDSTDSNKVVSVGDIVTYTIKTNVPYIDPNAQNKTFYIYDEIDGADYYLTGSGSVATVKMGNDSVGTIVIDPQDSHKFAVNLSSLINSANSNAGNEVVVTYTAKVTNVTVHNDSKAGHEGGSEYGSDSEDLYTGQITLTKYASDDDNDDLDDNEKLANAKFKVYKFDGGNKIYAKFDANNKFVEWANSKETATEIVTGDTGTVTVTGLDLGTYYFEETEAPEGYSRNERDVYAELKLNEGKATAVINAGTYMIDTQLAALPGTGGIGTTIFTIGGCLIMIIAAALFFANRRKAK